MALEVEYIGRTLFVDANGDPQFTADWNVPTHFRTLEVVVADGIYAAQRRLDTGMWVYAWTKHRGSVRVEPTITDIRYPSDENYDGPKPDAPVPPTWADVQSAFETLINDSTRTKGKVDAKRVADLLTLTFAAFHRMPFFIPAVVVREPADPTLRPSVATRRRQKALQQ